MRARKLTETNSRLIASPDYLAEFGRPETINHLSYHRLLHHSNRAGVNIWKLTDSDREQRQIRTKDGVGINDGQTLLNAAASGLGIAYLPNFLFRKMMEEGKIIDIMPELPLGRRAFLRCILRGDAPNPKSGRS
jgi:DNA-binding transcriptional LysR family regulator